MPIGWRNDRTIAACRISPASCGKVPPKVTPGTVVFTSPVTLRYGSGASMFGLNVSMWLAPPARKTMTTARSRTNAGSASAAAARARSSHGSDSPPRASDPARRKSRRDAPEQSRAPAPAWSVSIGEPRKSDSPRAREDGRG